MLRLDRPLALRTGMYATAALAMGLAARPVAGQSLISTTSDDVTLGFQVETPFFPGGGELRPWSSTLETDLLFRWGPNAFVQANLPLAFAGADFADGTSIYLGSIGANFIFGPPGSPSSFIGFTLPTGTNIAGPELAILVGVLPNLDEPELWSEDVMSVRGGILPTVQISEQARVGLRVGGALVAPNDLGNVWVYGRGGAWMSARVGAAELRGDVLSSYFINSDDGFDRQFKMYLEARAALPEAPGGLGVVLRLPLDGQARDVLDFSVGLSARMAL
jgi:hypothetical protein